jgi:signal transduction histidine kinase
VSCVGLRRPVVDRWLIAAVAVLVVGAGWLASTADPVARPLWQGGWGLLAASSAALLWRRAHPEIVLVVTGLCTAFYYGLGFPGGPEPVPFVVALYVAAVEGRRSVVVVATLCSAGVVTLVVVARGESPPSVSELVAVVAVLGAVVAAGEVGRARRAYQREAEARAALGERLRIARELHDVLGHHLAVISIQANAALLRGETRPELAPQALEVIKQSSADATRELRNALGPLRFGEDARLARIGELLDGIGLRTRLRLEGKPRPLPPEIELAGYRIVQEAVTNVVRHAAAHEVDVLLGYRPDALEIRIADDGTTPPNPPGGGIRGMRERAESLGGELAAEARESGGFAVTARIPA